MTTIGELDFTPDRSESEMRASNFVGLRTRLPFRADGRQGSYLFSVARGLKKLKPKERERGERDGFCFWRFYWLLQRALLLLLLAKPDSGATGCSTAT